jgi:TRAP-type C4-dicarboxylate transport system permease small subunit
MNLPFGRFRIVHRVVGALAGLSVCAIVAFMFTEIIARRLDIPNSWTTEVSGYLLIAVTFLSMGYADIDDGHIRIDALRDALPVTRRWAIDLFASIVTVVATGWLCYAGVLTVSEAYDSGSLSVTALHVPLAMIYLPLAIGSFLLMLQSAGTAVAITLTRIRSS